MFKDGQEIFELQGMDRRCLVVPPVKLRESRRSPFLEKGRISLLTMNFAGEIVQVRSLIHDLQEASRFTGSVQNAVGYP